jgi:hypothetical protein
MNEDTWEFKVRVVSTRTERIGDQLLRRDRVILTCEHCGTTLYPVGSVRNDIRAAIDAHVQAYHRDQNHE